MAVISKIKPLIYTIYGTPLMQGARPDCACESAILV